MVLFKIFYLLFKCLLKCTCVAQSATAPLLDIARVMELGVRNVYCLIFCQCLSNKIVEFVVVFGKTSLSTQHFRSYQDCPDLLPCVIMTVCDI